MQGSKCYPTFYNYQTDLKKHVNIFMYIKNVIVMNNRDFLLSTKILITFDEFGVPYISSYHYKKLKTR